MHRRRLFIILTVLYSLLFTVESHAQLPQIPTGLSYLSTSQNPDGTWQTGTAQVETTAATVSVLETLKLLNQTAGTPYTTGIAWLQAQTPLSVNYIAARLHALSLTDVTALIPSADTFKGGWGGDTGYETNPLDTALALQALKSANYSDTTIINPALAYLTTSQNPDGGWGFYTVDDSNVFITAMVSATLQQFPQMTTIATAVSRATAFLLAHQNADGGFGSSPSTIYETALAFAALAAVSSDATVLGNAVNYLTTNQTVNGSWNDDPYSSALALKALYLSENRPAPPPAPPTGGKLIGIVQDAITLQRIGNVSVTLENNDLFTANTDAMGNFTLADVPPGAQKVTFALSGYASTSVTATAVADTVTSLGTISMVSSYSTGTISGTVTDSNGKPLADVAIAVSGAWSGSTSTGADGSYAIAYVKPGEVTISAAKAGFQTVSGSGIVYARTTLSFSPRLSTTPPQATTGILVGRVVDSHWGLPIDHLPEEQGVTVTLSGGISVEPDPVKGGYFTIPDLAPNTYQVTVAMNGFTARTFRVMVLPGITTDLGTVRLEMTIDKMTLTGRVTDVTTGAAIPGAEVTILGSNLTGRADFAGTYGIQDLAVPGEYTVKASAPGYVGKSYLMRSSRWLQTMDIALSPKVTTGSLTGTVVDAATSKPLTGVTLALAGDPAVGAVTDSSGAFHFVSLAKGPQQVTLSLEGYAPRTLTTPVSAGRINNVGSIPLSVTGLPAAIQGTAWDSVANTPFGGVDIRVTGAGALQTVTAGDGTFKLDTVTPGTITIAATTPNRPAYYPAGVTGILEPGGIMVFNPALTTKPPATVEVRLTTGKAVYTKGETVAIAVNLTNTESADYAASLHLAVTDPSGATAFETSLDLNLPADSTIIQNLGFPLPVSLQGGRYSIRADIFDKSGMMLGTGTGSFGVATSQITVTPTLPAAFVEGANSVSFELVNIGTLAVSTGTLAVTLKDPDGQELSAGEQTFTLGLGERKTLDFTIPIPPLKFGTYTLSYTQGDETTAGKAIGIELPNSFSVTALFDGNSRRIRETATLTVTVNNTGRFNPDPTGLPVTVSLPDAGYGETKTLSPTPVVGDAAGGSTQFRFVIPETMTAGQHGTKITLSLPTDSSSAHSAFLAIPESSLEHTLSQTAFIAGDTISPTITNSGGVDTQVQYSLNLYDARSALIAEKTGVEPVNAGSSLSLSLAIPTGATDGPYNLVVACQDQKTAKEEIVSNPMVITGVKGTLQAQTNKQAYLNTEGITALSSIVNSGTALDGGNLHLQVTTAAGSQAQKTWTSQYDFQQGARNGVDTYGVNDWLIPDDDFELSVLDTDKWTTVGNVSVQSGKVVTNSSAIQSYIRSKWLLSEDFDIQVDFSQNNSVANQGAEFGIGSGSYWVFIKNTQSEGYLSGVQLNGSTVASIRSGGYASSGRFRITRTSTNIRTYYWNGSAWTQLVNYSNTKMTDAPNIMLWVWRGSGYSGTSAAFDNFQINSGKIVKVQESVDSVRLLPINDNFDDGVINDDRWSVRSSGSANTGESSGVLITEDTVTGIQSYANVAGHFPLTGDFDVAINWKEPVAPSSGDWGSIFQITEVDQNGVPDNRLAGNALHIKRAYINGLGHTFYTGRFDGSSWVEWSSPVTTSDVAGRFRIKRAGSNVTAWYWNGSLSRWEWNGNTAGYTWTNAWTTPCYVQIGAPNDLPNMPVVKTEWNNFRVNLLGKYSNTGTIRLRQDGGYNTSWQNIVWTSTEPLGTSISFRTRTAGSEAALATSAWSDYMTASGSQISSPPGRWVEIEATLATADINITPLLHDVSVIYSKNLGDVVWQTDALIDLVPSATANLNNAIGTLGAVGKYYLQGTLTSSTGQEVATSEYPFYVEAGDIHLSLSPDKKVYRPGETVTIVGEVVNRSTIAATALGVSVQGNGAWSGALFAETFDLHASGSHPFSFTTTAANDGIYRLQGVVKQNSATLATVADQFETASPLVAATLSAPDTAGSAPFTISLSLVNSSRVSATTNVLILNDGGDVIANREVTIPPGETMIIQHSPRIAGDTTYTATISGDLNLTLTKKVAYAVAATDVTVTSKIVPDKIAYNPNEPVTLTSTIAASAGRENLSARITVTNDQGQVLYSATSEIPILNLGQAITINRYWNTGTNPAGTYLASLSVIDASKTALTTATCTLTINSIARPAALLKGQLSVDRQSILTGEPVTVTYKVTNTGNIDLADIALSIQTVNLAEQVVYNEITDQTALATGAGYTASRPIDTMGYSAKDYLVVLKAGINGVEETISGTYFRVEGAPSAPALAGPTNGSDVDTFTPLLSISNATDSNDDRLTYDFEIYSDSTLTDRIVAASIPETAGITSWIVPVDLTENQTCYWRARAYDGKLYGPWMETAAFRVNSVNDLPTAPTVSSPTDGTTVAEPLPLLAVNNASDPDSDSLTYNFDIALDPDFAQVVANAQGIAAGTGTTSWRVPINLQENGWYYWRAQADDWFVDGPWSTTARFFVNSANEAPSAPVITLPADGTTVASLATDVIVNNSIDPDSTGLVYLFEADTAQTFDSADLIRSASIPEGQGTTTWQLSGLRDNTPYFIRAKAGDGSAESHWSMVTAISVNTANDPPTSPILANPSSGAGVNVFAPALSVHNATDPDNDSITYEFEVYADAALTSLVTRESGIAQTVPTTGWTVPVTLEENRTYYWRARGCDASLCSGWMPAASFLVNTANDAPGAPRIISPAEGSSVATLTPVFTIENSVDPDSDSLTYESEVYSGGTLVLSTSAIPGNGSGVTTWIAASALNDNSVYQWRVRANDGDRYGSWTPMATFTVHIPLTTIHVRVKIEPHTLKKAGRDRWVKAEIELPHGYKASDVDISSIRLEGIVPAELFPHELKSRSHHDGCDNDRSRHEHAELRVKFRRSAVLDVLPGGNHVPVHITGTVGGTPFEGVDLIRVIQ